MDEQRILAGARDARARAVATRVEADGVKRAATSTRDASRIQVFRARRIAARSVERLELDRFVIVGDVAELDDF